MSLENIYYIGQTVAVVAIVATLGAIYIQTRETLKQTRQATEIARTELSLSTWLSAGNMQMGMFNTPEGAEFMQRALFGNETLSDAEKTRLGISLVILVGQLESCFYLRERGLIDPHIYERMGATVGYYMQFPRARRWWRFARNAYYSSPFREVLDEVVKNAEEAAQKEAAAIGSGPGIA